MTDTLDGVKKLPENDNENQTQLNDATQYDDATLEAMAKKSGDTVEHMKKMLGLYDKEGTDTKAKGDTSNDDTSNDGSDDKLLAGKYKTEEDLDKGIQNLIDKYGKEEAYKMLEGKMGSKSTDTGADKGDGSDSSKGDALSTDDSGDDGSDGGSEEGIDMNKYFDEYSENNGLSIESYKELADAGFNKDLVDSFIEGQVARVELFTNQVYEIAGSEEQFNSMVDWGSKNLNSAQKDMFNNAVNSGNLEQARAVVDALKARYEAAEGSFKRGGIQSSSSQSGSSVEGFASVAEMTAAMRDPRYATDTAYQNQVKQKLAKSNF